MLTYIILKTMPAQFTYPYIPVIIILLWYYFYQDWTLTKMLAIQPAKLYIANPGLLYSIVMYL